MPFDFRCRHCPPDSGPVLHVQRYVEDREDELLRQHLRTAHPAIAPPTRLAELLDHFTVEQASP